MILTGPEIRKEIEAKNITISPFNPAAVNPNSVNLRLGPRLLVYTLPDGILDTIKSNPTETIVIPTSGYVLRPGTLYLAETVEHIATNVYVPIVSGRSSTGRLGIAVEVSAGLADVGWAGKLTLELTVVHPTRVYIDTEIAQVYFNTVVGEKQLYRGKYLNADGPQASMLHLDRKV